MKWLSMMLALALLLIEGGECQQQRGRRIRVRGRRIRPSADSAAVAQAPQDTSSSAAGCPEPEGLQLYPDPNTCHAFYQCANGTLTYEECPNGLLFDPAKPGVHNHCSYIWDAQCGERPFDDTPRGSGPCEYQFGIYSSASGDPDLCHSDYIKCQFGKPVPAQCDTGLVYDHRIHSCNWPDQLAGYIDCDPSRILGFKCPGADELTELESRFAPFPRFAIKGLDAHYILCVNGSPRLSSCGPGTSFSPSTLTCVDRF